MIISVLLLSSFFSTSFDGLCEEPLPYVPTSDYTVRNVRGWNILVSPDLIADPELDRAAMNLIELQLAQICVVVPEESVRHLQTVKIWLQRQTPNVNSPCYHPSVEWLIGHGINPDKAKCIDIPNARYMIGEYDRQPMMILHELAHAYHNNILENGFDNARIRDIYRQAMAQNRYKSVLTYWQTMEKAYAATNHHEYFAELTECYFGENDFYPFVKTEFKQYDPEGFQMIETIWNVKKRY